MDFSAYFKPLTIGTGKPSAISSCMVAYEDSVDLAEFKIALLFAPEYRSAGVEGILDAQSILDQLGSLFFHGEELSLLIMGELIPGDTIGDSESALAHVVDELTAKRVLPVIVGGSRDLAFSIYKAFEQQEQIISISSVDPFFNIGTDNDQGYIGRIVNEQPNYLFNYSNLGYQTYLVDSAELKLADELYFDAYRLGEVRGNVMVSEPIIRSSEIFALSVDSIKASDFGGSLRPQPNGFYAEEVCQMMRYAGISEKLKTVLISDIGQLSDHSDQLLITEMIWCLMDGVNAKRSEIPNKRSDSFLKYRVSLKEDEFQLVFYKSLQTDRWWMEVPVPPEYANKYRKHHLIPCGYEDYKQATQDDLPDRWWKAYKKML